ncbi:MAG: hypothetical protein HY736_19420 [Verrucomicrobia bacterium]|nr:hypothetical protein [Verrucomicrobiota bacterium]
MPLERPIRRELLSHGWAIGTSGWRQAVAQEHAQLALAPEYERKQLREIKEARWRGELDRMLHERGLSLTESVKKAPPTGWKIEVAAELRRRVGAPYQWMAEILKINRPASLRMQVHRCLLQVSA